MATEAEAVERMTNDYWKVLEERVIRELPYLYDPHQWRVDKYWNEPCDNIMKAYAPLFKNLFDRYGGMAKKPGQQAVVTVDEFTEMIMDSGIINDSFTAPEIPICFNQALELFVNEVDSDKYSFAQYPEFLEAIARSCDESSMPMHDAPDTPLAERQSLPLHVKIDNAIPFLLKNCTPKGFSEKYPHPKKHTGVGLYILSNGKFW